MLHKARGRRGALDFDAPEARFRIDAAEHVTAIDLVSRNDAHRLVEECMILANVAVASELAHTQHADASIGCTGNPKRRSSTGCCRH